MTPLRQQMDKDMVLRGMSPRTREAYLGAVYGLAKHYRRAPDRLSEKEAQAYLLYLLQERKLAWSSCNIVRHGLRFLYQVTLHRPQAEFMIPVGSATAEAAANPEPRRSRRPPGGDGQRQTPGAVDDHLWGRLTGFRSHSSQGR